VGVIIFGLKRVRKGCLGCLGAAGSALALALLVWIFAPWIYDEIIDWVVYVEPPEVAVAPDGAAEVRRALRDIYMSVEGDRDPKNQTVVVSEGAMNGLLGDPSDGSALRAARVDLGDDAATLYAAVDLKQLAENRDYRDLLSSVPSFLHDRRVSVRVEFSGVSTARDRLNFSSVDVKLGRVWVPFSARWALPIIQRVAERKLGTRLPEEGLPLPPGSSARIADDRLTVDLGRR
jgi:hypothetical protein